MQRHMRRRLAAAILGAATLSIAFLVLSPQPDAASSAVSVVTRWLAILPGVNDAAGSRTLVEFSLNTALFMPLGLGLALWHRSFGPIWATGVGFWVSVALEVAQAVLLPGRSAQASDVVANSLGCALGFIAVDVWLRSAKRSGRSNSQGI